ncbi:type IV pilin protein [Pseudoxanthomonas wuyuanensis]|uniref:Type IV pilus assembly protein PilE n=1 Tax=Pseudoxanthomonas wuyuanensis TaxID=1073196 RepID=A0A286DCU3_9GAMM|nr:type IV pilin protein [Pseudoxanthomonas wuyuanensis]KAF1720770.1 type IV pilin protein [Pseudoxanthomonas wuyuanensis]SOD56461.1 type IV pilus assembly protein PilE [Pseudoxanthomonas wuyuanensis]
MNNMPMARKFRAEAGFTLLELMIVVAVVAILSTIAYGSYQDQIVKSRRAAGASCLQERAQFMERYYTTHLTYNKTGSAPAIAQCDNEVSPHYQVSLVAGSLNAKAFTLQAVPQGAQSTRDTLCGTLTLNQQGVRGESGTATSADQCW